MKRQRVARCGRLAYRLAMLGVLGVALSACDSGGDSDGGDGQDTLASFGLAVANLDGVNLADIVTANVQFSGTPNPGSAKVILRDTSADDNFAAGVFYDMGTDSRAIAVGDLNADGRNDMLVSNSDANQLIFRLQSNAGGTFLNRVSLDAALNPTQAVIADLNGDGYNDIAVTGSSIWLLFNDPDNPGNFDRGGVINVAGRAIEAADVNGDGRVDLVADVAARSIIVLLQDPVPLAPGRFTTPGTEYEVGNTPYDIAVDDINGDRRPDIAVVNWGTFNDPSAASVSVLYQKTAPIDPGEFNDAVDFPIEGRGTSIVIADLDRDSLLDIAATNELAVGGGVSVLYQVFTGLPNLLPGFSGPLLWNAYAPYGLGAADFNGDGANDLAVSNSSGVLVLYQRPLEPGTFSPPLIVGGNNADR